MMACFTNAHFIPSSHLVGAGPPAITLMFLTLELMTNT